MGEPLLIVQTSRRPGGADYLSRTLPYVDPDDRIVPWRRVVICDGPLTVPVLGGGFQMLYASAARKGESPTFFAALALAAALDADPLLYFEDDARPCRGAVARMLAVGVPDDCAFVSYWEHTYHVPPGIHRVSMRVFVGKLALAIPGRTLQMIARGNFVLGAGGAGDLQLARLLAEYSSTPTFAVHEPPLVQHVGEVSAVNPGVPLTVNGRYAERYPGDDFDARSLPMPDEMP
ncbi:MAG: hypothetical protein ACREMV_01930 [Gemmatimonadales bacterium]